MTRRLLLLSYWFPPNNAIGASRAAAMARFFTERGWSVTVIGADSGAVSKDFDIDLSGIEVHRVSDTIFTQLLNILPGRTRVMRLISAFMRYVAFPDAFRTTTRKMGKIADDLMAQGRHFDVILSTALPFSQHEVACRAARKSGALLVLDNRDTWACSPYRRRLPFSEGRERRYEHYILSSADLITTISDGMTHHFCENYKDLSDRISTIRNGVDHTAVTYCDVVRGTPQGLRIAYTGILYGEKRDIRPVLEAARDSGLSIAFDFFGAESSRVAAFKAQFPMLEIIDHGRVSRGQAMAAQSSADALLVGLGLDAVEKSFLPGKFYEYVGTGRPIIVIANSDYEIGKLVEAHNLGIVTRDPSALRQFLAALAAGRVQSRASVPKALTRDHQLRLLENRILAVLDGPRQATHKGWVARDVR